MQLPDKIYIIGAAGSGKSFLARKISTIKKIPYFCLDDILRYKKYTEKLPKERRTYKLHQILKRHNKWVIDGCSLDRPDECYQKADLVIILNVSKYVVAWRILKRYVSHVLHGNFQETFIGMIGLIQRAMTYKNPKTRHSLYRHIDDCKKYMCQYVVIRDAKEILD